ncbi:MAG: hypothetical protein ACE5GW_05510, partial [Planctomycetota bacterium]
SNDVANNANLQPPRHLPFSLEKPGRDWQYLANRGGRIQPSTAIGPSGRKFVKPERWSCCPPVET